MEQLAFRPGKRAAFLAGLAEAAGGSAGARRGHAAGGDADRRGDRFSIHRDGACPEGLL
jgi:hypothetical protein